MPSPFPGMNPWLESPGNWPEFHQLYIDEILARLVPLVRPRYFVRVHVDIYIHEPAAAQRWPAVRPDGSVMLTGLTSPGQPASPVPVRSTAVGAVTAPCRLTVPMTVDEIRVPALRIVDRQGDEVVTVIELLSPSNKDPGADRESYLGKRMRVLRTPAHLVEIDLLRGGPKMPTEPVPECDYGVLVSRREERPGCEFWPVGLRERLPVVPIPLRAPGEQVPLDLQAALHAVYDRAGMEGHLYRFRVEPPLSPADAEWAAACLRSAGVGTG